MRDKQWRGRDGDSLRHWPNGIAFRITDQSATLPRFPYRSLDKRYRTCASYIRTDSHCEICNQFASSLRL